MSHSDVHGLLMQWFTSPICRLLSLVVLGACVASRVMAADPAATAPAEIPVTLPEGLIDAHVHFQNRQPGDLAAAAAWMQRMHVARIINHPLRQSLPRNEQERQQMLANYRQYKDTIYHFCIIFPEEVQTVDQAVERLTKEKQDGAIGFGEHYGPGMFFDDPRCMRLFAACEKVGLPVMFHMDKGKNLDEPGLPHLEHALKTYPHLIFIAHSDWWRHIGEGACDRLLDTYPNLYADISCSVSRSAIGKDKALARKFFIRHADKLLFGSDSGWWSLGHKKAAPEFTYVGELNLPEDVLNKICRDNACRIFGFKPSGEAAGKPGRH